jgi:MFS family permease
VIMNVAYALSAYPAGWLSDHASRWSVLAAGAALLVAADLVLAVSASPATALFGVLVWGLHMGFTQGLFSALVADVAPAAQRGTAFGVFNLVTGLALLAASVLAGALWDSGGPRLTFVTGAGLTVAAGAVALVLHATGRLQQRAA